MLVFKANGTGVGGTIRGWQLEGGLVCQLDHKWEAFWAAMGHPERRVREWLKHLLGFEKTYGKLQVDRPSCLPFQLLWGRITEWQTWCLGIGRGRDHWRGPFAICQKGVLLAPVANCPSVSKYLECFGRENLPTHSFTLCLLAFLLLINVDIL